MPTDQQQVAIDDYVNTGFKSWIASMLRANYSPKYANALGYKLLGNVGIRQAIDKKKTEIAAKNKWNAKALTDKYSDIGTASLAVGDRTAALRAYENISKHIGYYEQDNAQRQTQQAIQVNIDTPEALEQGIERLKGLKDDRKAIDTEYEDAEDAICKE